MNQPRGELKERIVALVHAADEPITNIEIAEATGMPAHQIAAICARLRDAKLIERSDKGGRRSRAFWRKPTTEAANG